MPITVGDTLNATIGAPITGGNGLVKLGGGTLTLGGANTYAGPTSVANGTLALSGDGSIASSEKVSVATGATLDIQNVTTSATVKNLEGSGTVSVGTKKLVVDATSATTFSGSIQGTGTLEKAGAETLTLSGSASSLTSVAIANGTLNVTNVNALGDSVQVNLTGPDASLALKVADTIGRLEGVDGSEVSITGTLTLKTSTTSALFDGAISGGGSLVMAGTGTQILSGANTYTGGTTISSGTLSIDGGSISHGSASTIVGNTAGKAVLDIKDGAVTNSLGRIGTVSQAEGTVLVGKEGTWTSTTLTVGSGAKGTLTVENGGDVFSTTANVGVANGSTGTVVVSGTGSKWTNEAVLTVGGTGTGTGQLVISNGGRVEADTDMSGSYGLEIGKNSSVVIGSADTSQAGTIGTLHAPMINIKTGGKLIFNHDAAAADQNATLQSEINMASGASIEVYAGATLLSGVLSNQFGSSAAIKVYGGLLDLAGDNNLFAGTTYLYGGTLRLSHEDALGANHADAGNLRISGNSTLDLAANLQLDASGSIIDLSAAVDVNVSSGSTTLALPITGSGSLTKTGDGTLVLAGPNNYTGGTVIEDGTLQGDTTSLKGNIAFAAVDAPVSLVFDQADDGIFEGAISGEGTVERTGSGVLTLSGVSTYAGTTEIGAGTLVLTNADAAGSSTIVFSQTARSTLRLDAPSLDDTSSGPFSLNNTLKGFGANDLIDLQGLNFLSGPVIATFTSGKLEITQVNTTVTYTFDGLAEDTTFSAFADSDGSTLLAVAPSVAIEVDDTTLTVGEITTVTLTFSDVPLGFDKDDVIAPNGTLSNFTVSDDGRVYTALFTTASDRQDETNVIGVGTGWTAHQNVPPPEPTVSTNYVVDTQAPTVTITDDVAAGTPNGPVTYTFTFSEGVTGFTEDNVVVTGGTAGTFAKVSFTQYTLVVTPTADTQAGTIKVNVAAGAAQDAVGNNSVVATEATQTYDTQKPTVAIKLSDTSLNDTTNESVVTFTFSEEPTGFTDTDITATKGKVTNLVQDTTDPKVWTATFTAEDGFAGQGSVTVNASTFADAATNANTAATPATVAIDTANPVVTLVAPPASGSYKAGDHLDVPVTFSENVTVTGDDSTLGLIIGGTDVEAAYLSHAATTITYRYTVQDGDTDGDGIALGAITLKTTVIIDVAGNPAVATFTAPNASAVLVDTTAPSAPRVALVEDTGSNVPDKVTSNGALSITSENGATLQYSVDNGGNWAPTFTAAEGANSVIVRQTDLAGNTSAASAAFGFTLDTKAPTVTVTLSDATLTVNETALVTFTFSEAPTGFTKDNVTAPNGSLSAVAATGNPLVFTATFTPTASVNDTSNVITVDAAWTDAAGNAPAGSASSANYTVDTVVVSGPGGGNPTPTPTDGNDTLPGTSANDTVNAGGGNDSVSGGAGDDTLGGGDGEDTLLGGTGDDLVMGGNGNDLIFGGEGNDTALGGTGDDTLYAGNGTDLVFGGEGNDEAGGGAGEDTLYAGSGADTLFGGSDNDTVLGGNDNDVLAGGAGADAFTGGAGDDKVAAGGGNDSVYAGEGNDEVFGALGDDLVYGGAGSDTLYGGAGSDTLSGGAGNDALYGGGDADVFVFTGASGDDVITGFSFDEGDRLDLNGQTYTLAAQQGGVLLSLEDGGTILLAGLSPDQVQANWFV